MNLTQKPLKVTVRNREQIVYEGTAYALSSKNAVGVFDVLPLHANFITLLNQTLLIHEVGGTKKELIAENGILRVVKNQIEIFLGVKNLTSTHLT